MVTRKEMYTGLRDQVRNQIGQRKNPRPNMGLLLNELMGGDTDDPREGLEENPFQDTPPPDLDFDQLRQELQENPFRDLPAPNLPPIRPAAPPLPGNKGEPDFEPGPAPLPLPIFDPRDQIPFRFDENTASAPLLQQLLAMAGLSGRRM